MPSKRLMRTAATASMVSGIKTNKAVRNSASQPVAASAPTQPASSGLTQQLEELGALRDKGILTEEEFSAKKKQLLGI